MKSVLRWLARLEAATLACLLLAMIGLACLQIILRNGFDSGISWGDDAVRTLVLWVAMIGSMVAAGRGEHIRIEALVRYLPPLAAAIVARFVDVLTAGLCAALAWYGYEFAALEYEDGFKAFAAVPSWFVVSVIPLAFGVIGARYMLHALFGRPAADEEGAAP